MSGENLQSYLKAVAKLKRATKNGIKAPHKPVLLISIIQSIANGEIRENKIEITPQLVARFKDNWKWLVKEDFFKPNFALPFYHLISDKFWHLQTFNGKQIQLTSSFSIRSFAQLKDTVAYSFFDEPLFNSLLQQNSRELIYHFLLDTYFKAIPALHFGEGLIETVTEQILNDSPVVYQRLVETADEEEVFVRCGVFKRVVPQLYNYTCCISGMRIISGYDIQMVDACHIIPFAVSHNDTISNGISLCPNLHRAFDRGLISLNNEYRIIVSESFTENVSENGIRVYEGKSILLPDQQFHYPAMENVEWHRANVFKS